ncbi:hypothetical protein GA0061099_1002208 [Bradyrhizobium yuanmingense]|uniref:Uncharacterized protein n=1 Tax=Bradyrhizobium yuanmingense TaxID=108015 RepID=A0A1C3UK73_9BRAD|nr:hypothetical protein IQ15_00742 [Bradyrhizobium yuanmingense]SCB15903.1 hypothetical protein GA0061099_1002208 [Bradyrhizobium yuanmingense]
MATLRASAGVSNARSSLRSHQMVSRYDVQKAVAERTGKKVV